MKKLFIAAMALATIVSCSKDDGVPTLETSKKAIAIQITNAATATTRATLSEGDTAQGNNNEACATAAELQVLFANNSGVIVEHYALTAGVTPATPVEGDGVTYMFHGVDQSVTQVAVARWDATDKDKDIAITDGATNISVLLDRAEDLELNANRAISEIALYGVDDSLTKTDATHTGSPVNNNTHPDEETTYLVYTANVEVAPRFARIEVTGISCTDLGDENKDGVADLVTGYDEMVLNSFTFSNTGHTYKLAAIEGEKWSGSYKYATTVDGKKTWSAATESSVVRSLAPDNGAWSWNVEENSPWADMTLSLNVDAADYTVQIPVRELVIGDLKYTGTEADPTAMGFVASTKETGAYYLSTYKKNHIYRLNIPFSEADLEDVNEDMCVSVTVDIVNWVVVPVTPVFGK